MVRCFCCKNPWNQDGEGHFGTFTCAPCAQDSKGFTGIDPVNFNSDVNLKENFFNWSNGGWMAKNPIPAEYSSWNTFLALRDLNLERLRLLLDELGGESSEASANEEQLKLSYYFKSYMNEERIESDGLQDVLPILDLCKTATLDATAKIAQLHSRFGVNVFFKITSSPDKSNSVHTLCALYQSGLGLPDRDYYFQADKEEKREKYVAHIEGLLNLIGLQEAFPEYSDEKRNKEIAKEILLFETTLAGAHLSRTDCRDPNLTFNKMTVSNLAAISKPPFSWSTYLAKGLDALPPFDWTRYFEYVGKGPEELGQVNVATVDAVKGFSALLSSPTLSHYLVFHCINSFSPHLSRAFSTAHFEFYEKTLEGTQEQKPRWKKALSALESALGDALGKLYVSKYFSGDAKPKALKIVEAVRSALRNRLLEVPWMSESTRAEALKKMERFAVKIGFPEKWIDYSSLEVSRGSHVPNLLSSRRFDFALELSRMNAPTDRTRWFMTPQTVNAYYHPSLNEIVFPAAILQSPFFDADADEAVQFGSLGAVVGHEMTHGFDDQGRKYDFEGNLRDWWAAGDGEEYERRAAVMIQQAAAFKVHDVSLNGKLTCGENIADLGGVKLALRALNASLAESSSTASPPLINGFSPAQRLFLAWSQTWRENVKKERALQLVTLDPHGPNELRCNGTLSNVQEFFEAFEIVEGDKMYRGAAERVDIW